MPLAYFFKKSEKRTKLGHLKVTFPNGPLSPFSIWFSRILLVGELRTHEPRFTDDGVRYPHGKEVGRSLKNYRKVCIVHVRRAEQ